METFTPHSKNTESISYFSKMVTWKLGKDFGVISISITILAVTNLRHSTSLIEIIQSTVSFKKSDRADADVKHTILCIYFKAIILTL